MPTPRSSGGAAVTSSSPKKICPAVGVSSPQIMFKVVLLPQPEGPSSPTSLPSGTVKLSESTAVTSPELPLPRAGNRLVRPISLIFMHTSPQCQQYTAIIAHLPGHHKRGKAFP